MGAGFAIMGGLQLLFAEGVDAASLTAHLGFALAAAGSFAAAFGRLQLVENGIRPFWGLIRWDQIRAYRWTVDSTLWIEADVKPGLLGPHRGVAQMSARPFDGVAPGSGWFSPFRSSSPSPGVTQTGETGMRSRVVSWAGLLVVGACGADPGPGPGSGPETDPEPATAPVPTVRDSAGVRIVEYASLAGIDSTAWRLAIGDSVRIGRTGTSDHPAPYQFGLTLGAVRLGDGSVAVADRHARELRQFDGDGTFIRSIGGPGQGPGELMGLNGLYTMRGDSLVVSEGQRWTVFDADGAFAFTRWIEPVGATFPAVIGAFRDGTLLVRYRNRRQTETFPWGSETTGTTTYSRLHRDRGIVNTFGEFPLPVALSVDGVTHPLAGSAPNLVFVYVGVQGGRSARAAGDRFYWTTAGLREVHVVGLDGDLQMILRFDGLDQARRDEVAIGRVRYVEYDLPPEVEAHIRGRREAVAPSPFSALLVDDLGNFWLRAQEFSTTDTSAPALWYVLDPQGMPLAALRMPYAWGQGGSSTLTRITGDFVLTHEWDEFLVDTYVLTPLEKR